MGQKPNWTQSDLTTLSDMWGEKSIPHIAKTLGRSVNAIRLKASRLGLGAHMESSPYIVYQQFAIALGYTGNTSYLKMRLKRDGFPFVRKKVENNSFLMVDLDAFWKWTAKNKDKLNFANFELNALGAEPKWVAAKRTADWKAAQISKEPWTKHEDEKLQRMLEKRSYGYAEISTELNRTEGAIKKRMLDLRLELRPIKAKPMPWTDDEVKTLQEMRGRGYGYEEIGVVLGRSALSCRARVERLDNPDYFKRENRRRRAVS